MVSTYLNAVTQQKDIEAGLTITHQGGEAYSFDVQNPLKQALRFLLLGSEGGTFYANERKLTSQNIASIARALDTHGIELVDLIVDVSQNARAPKNDPALLALAVAASYQNSQNPAYAEQVRSYALSNLPKVARIGTHLFHFAAYADAMRGWGSGLRKAIARWFTVRNDMSLVNQVTKYRQRDGWSMADLLRKSHPIPVTETQDTIFKYVVDGILPENSSGQALEYLAAVEAVKDETDIATIIRLIGTYQLPREVLPTQALNNKDVWHTLLFTGQGMPLTAMIRNLSTMSKIGLLTQGSDAARHVNEQLRNQELIKAARVHPIDLLKAQFTYKAGKGVKSDATWTPVQSVVSSLEQGFYLSFGNVTPTGKRIMLALDVSGSMTTGEELYYYGGYAPLAGVPGLSPRIASGALALITAKTEREYETLGFSHRFIDLRINEHDSLDSVLAKISDIPFGGTDCGLPMRHAIETSGKYDAFIVYTDNETGGRNPSVDLRNYRNKSGIRDARLIVNAMASNGFSIADPTDRNMLDVVGFDTAAPQIVSEFIRDGF